MDEFINLPITNIIISSWTKTNMTRCWNISRSQACCHSSHQSPSFGWNFQTDYTILTSSGALCRVRHESILPSCITCKEGQQKSCQHVQQASGFHRCRHVLGSWPPKCSCWNMCFSQGCFGTYGENEGVWWKHVQLGYMQSTSLEQVLQSTV